MSLEQFFDEEIDNGPYSDRVCLETRRRIRVSVAAWAYEALLTPIMDDAQYDKLAYSIDLTIDTRRPDLDKWFRSRFKPYTGSWIHAHPERGRINQIAQFVLQDR